MTTLSMLYGSLKNSNKSGYFVTKKEISAQYGFLIVVMDFGSDNKLKRDKNNSSKTQIYSLLCTSSMYLALLHSKKYSKRNKREPNIGYKTIMHVKLSFGFWSPQI